MSDEAAKTVWVEDRGWRLLDTAAPAPCCRMPKCGQPAVAALARRTKRGKVRWWAYCAAHLYGRRIEGGKVMTYVHPESPAAKRGFVDGTSS